MIGRPRTLKLSDSEFKRWLLNNFIDENGIKVAVTSLLNSDKFMNETGLKRINKQTGEIEPCSRGTLSNWCKKLKEVEPLKGQSVNEESIYQWGKERGLIKNDFEEWSRLYNRGGTSGELRELKSERIILNKVAEKLNSGIRSSNVKDDLSIFRKFLIRAYGYDVVENTILSLRGGVN
jgi:hypothetical protein